MLGRLESGGIACEGLWDSCSRYLGGNSTSFRHKASLGDAAAP